MATIINANNDTTQKEAKLIRQNGIGFFDDEFEDPEAASERSISPLDSITGKIKGPAGTLISFVTNPNVMGTVIETKNAAWELITGDIIGKQEAPKKSQEAQEKEIKNADRVQRFNTEANKHVKEAPKAARVEGQIMSAAQLVEMLQVDAITAEMVEANGDIKAYYEVAAQQAITYHQEAQKRSARKALAGAGSGKSAGRGMDMNLNNKENHGANVQSLAG